MGVYYREITGRFKVYNANGEQFATADDKESAELIVKAVNQFREWQPLATAPRDKTHILVHCARWDQQVREDFLTPESKWVKGYEPTHWQPLPPPPDTDSPK